VEASHSIAAAIRAMPKIELHRHLEGSWRLKSLSSIAREYCLPIDNYDIETIRPHVQIMPAEPRTWENFLGKFRFLRQFFRSETIIKRVTREVIADAAADNIKYMELRFTPQALNNVMRCEYGEVVHWVCTASQAAAVEHNIQVRLIVSMNRHEEVSIGEAVLDAALAHRDHGVVAIDLAGQEAIYPAAPFSALFQRAKREGMYITVHAGEWAGANSIYEALDLLGADRVGHGIRAVESPALMDSLVERGAALEVCPTSNVDSGVVPSLAEHPLPTLYQRGIYTTINTDDPLISNINLSDQLIQLVEHTSLTLDDLKQHQLVASRVVFLPPHERALLVTQFEQWFS